jgi:hypothetical protein
VKGRRRAAALTVLAVVAGLALPVLAAFVVAVDDPADTRGLLDVHQVRFDDASDGLPAWTVITFDEWTVRQIWDRGNVLLHLDTFGPADPDYSCSSGPTGPRSSPPCGGTGRPTASVQGAGEQAREPRGRGRGAPAQADDRDRPDLLPLVRHHAVHQRPLPSDLHRRGPRRRR